MHTRVIVSRLDGRRVTGFTDYDEACGEHGFLTRFLMPPIMAVPSNMCRPIDARKVCKAGDDDGETP